MGEPPPLTTIGHGGTIRLTNWDLRHCTGLTTRNVVKPETDPNTPQQSNKQWQTPAQHHWAPPGLTSQGPKGPKQGPPDSNTTSRQRPPEGQRAKPMPKAHPVAIATATKPEHWARTRTAPQRQQAPPLQNATQSPHRTSNTPVEQQRRPLYQPCPSRRPRRTMRAARQAVRRQGGEKYRLGYHRPPKVTGRHRNVTPAPAAAAPADGQGPASQQRHSRSPSTVKGRTGQKASTPTSLRGGVAHANDNRRRSRYRHRDRPSHAYRGPSVQGGPPLKSAGQNPSKYGDRRTLEDAAQLLHHRARHLRISKDLNNYHRTRRTATRAEGQGPTSHVHRLPSGHRQTVGPPTRKKAGTAGTRDTRADHKS
ncbi:hypothetical protein WOLCODRAFT_153292 [Wolfiporia cocos MD-104 SS10]|uniref:Uncharacterized protein n=1 Tax=Wolfiporia cocos (strain MD-104) TaxID=742152 RepID=A0A2H3JP13_WOLCO|nr:hypothetical protein WOLCODRAFT_153292 [Wolfiporia cocos MD-104 SS10]